MKATDSLDRSRVPEVGPPPSMTFPEVQEYRLDNGMRVVLWERHALPLVSLELQFRGGASTHPASRAGLAALAADMIDEGTTTRDALEIADALDVLGATLTSSAGYDASHVRLSVLRDKLPEGLAVVADVVMRPTFPESEVVRVRRERVDRVLQRSAEPAALAEDSFVEVLYGRDHAYGASLLGTRESLEALTRADVEAFHRARYAPGQATLVVVGDIARADLDALLARTFAGWRGRGVDPDPLPAAPVASRRAVYLVDRPGATQSEVRLGCVGASRDTPDFYPLAVMNTILGGSFTSRLNMKLREERGFTYGAGSTFDMRVAPGPFEAGAAVSTQVTDAAVADFVDEIRRLRDDGVSVDELARARNYLALRVPQRFESVDDVVRRLAELVAYGIPLDFYAGYVSGVDHVDARDVRRVAERYLPVERMTIVVAGDRSLVEEPLRALGLGPVTVLDPPPASVDPESLPPEREEQ